MQLASEPSAVTHSEPLPIDKISPLCLHTSGASSTAGPSGVSFHGAAPVESNGSIWLSLFSLLSVPRVSLRADYRGKQRGPVLYIAETASFPRIWDNRVPLWEEGGYIPLSRSPPISRSPVRLRLFCSSPSLFPPEPPRLCQHKMHPSTLAAVAALPLLHTVLAQGAQGNGKTTRYWDCWYVPCPTT